jgi:hypothetical protein
MEKYFPIAPMDKNAKIMSGLIMKILGLASLGLIWLIPYLFSPSGYLITSKGITIRQKATSHFISKDRIKSVRLISSVKPGIGLNWISGQFGYAGIFSLESGATACVYATRWNDMVEIQTVNGDPYLLSPQDPKNLIKHIDKLIDNT